MPVTVELERSEAGGIMQAGPRERARIQLKVPLAVFGNRSDVDADTEIKLLVKDLALGNAEALEVAQRPRLEAVAKLEEKVDDLARTVAGRLSDLEATAVLAADVATRGHGAHAIGGHPAEELDTLEELPVAEEWLANTPAQRRRAGYPGPLYEEVDRVRGDGSLEPAEEPFHKVLIRDITEVPPATGARFIIPHGEYVRGVTEGLIRERQEGG